MQYVVCLATSHRVMNRIERDGENEVRARVHIATQYIHCVDIEEAKHVAERLSHAMRDTVAEPGVKVWNGKGSSYISLSDLEQIYEDMTTDGRSRGKPSVA